MIRRAALIGAARVSDGRTIRRLAFVPVTTLPVATVCRVASGSAERIASLLASHVVVEATEPLLVDQALRPYLFDGAQVLRVRGEAADAFVIVRAADARRLADAVFSNAADQRAHLSAVESRVIDRIGRAVAAECLAICGRTIAIVPESDARAAREAAVYFEFRVFHPVTAAIGVALNVEPVVARTTGHTVAQVDHVRVSGRARLGHAKIALQQLLSLTVGSVIVLDTRLDAPATLDIGGHIVARGTCGIQGDVFAFRVAMGEAGAR